LHMDISPNEWWKNTQKYANQTINHLHNDENTPMKRSDCLDTIPQTNIGIE
jgi:hypothetical protein